MTDPFASPEQWYVVRMRAVIAAALPLLRDISDEQSARHPAPGKWSPREVIGHLVDSASNNHQRFVRAVWQDDLVFPGYEQDEWVELQRYQDAPWHDLLVLWSSFNAHMARVMVSIPESVRMHLRLRHNLDELAWCPVPKSEPVTLEYFMADYVGHLEHHLRQILGLEWDRSSDLQA
jgi:hypothetical protein